MPEKFYNVDNIQDDASNREKSPTTYSSEIVRPEDWDKYKTGLMEVEIEAFSGTGFSEDLLRNLVQDENNFTFMVKEGDKVVGYVNATPHGEDKAYITSIAVLPSHQGRGIVGTLSSALEQELVRQGYLRTCEDANDDNGYADKIKRHYGNRVVVYGEPHPSPWGNQRYIEIRLTDQ